MKRPKKRSPGAGRPKLPEGTVKITRSISLPPEQWAKLTEISGNLECSRSATVDLMISAQSDALAQVILRNALPQTKAGA